MDKDELKKNNKCTMCEGRGYHNRHNSDKTFPCLCKDGTYIGQLENFDIPMDKRKIEQLLRDYKELQEWAKKISTCKTCSGDQYHVLGGCKCKECGLPGLQVWPG